MKQTPLKSFAHDLSEKAKSLDATPATMLAATMKCIFADESLTTLQLADLCNVSTRALKQNKEQIEALSSALKDHDLVTLGDDPDTLKPLKKARKAAKTDLFEDGEEALRYPKDFQLFLKVYPNHGKHRIESKNYQKMLGEIWHKCEQDGYTGDNVFSALLTQRQTIFWNENDGENIPPAWDFLTRDLYRFYASDTATSPNEWAGLDSKMVEFCREYPRQTNPCSNLVIQGWESCLEKGYTPQELFYALKCFKNKKAWHEQDGRFVPRADAWLWEAIFADYIPYIRDLMRAPRGGEGDELRSDSPDEFIEFCRCYPGCVGNELTDVHYDVWKAWKKLEHCRNYSGGTILYLLDEAIKKNQWNDANKGYAPHALSFLRRDRIEKYAEGYPI